MLTCVSSLKAQHNTLREALRTILFDQRIYNHVFFDYKGTGNFSTTLPKGRYAFIYPDSVFTLNYPEIHYTLALSWGTEKKMGTITYVKTDSSTLFVSNNMDPDVKLYILFEKILISGNNARFKFSTTCVFGDGETGTRHFFDVELVYDEIWKIKRYSKHEVNGCRWEFPGRTISIDSLVKK
jgi:hypothetical protein